MQIFAELNLYVIDTMEFFLPAAAKPVLLSAEHTREGKKSDVDLNYVVAKNNGDIQMCPEEVQE